ncbi:hypothetical protein ACJ41O_004017 [Fusarium nematophilum]
MLSGDRSLESNRLEIVLIAAGVLLLVSPLGILILMGVGFRPPARGGDAENGPRSTAPGVMFCADHASASNEPFRDRNDSFINSVRRRSQSLAEEFKLELSNLKRNFPRLTTSSADQPEAQSLIDRVRRFSVANMLTFSPESSELITDCESCYEYLDSPLSATGRDEDAAGARRRASRTVEEAADCDLEAQHPDTPLL